jgi:CBS domain-containing protein
MDISYRVYFFVELIIMKTAAMKRATRASDLMARNPLSIGDRASVRDAAAFLLTKQIGAAPVINEAGRAVGVVSLTDVARYTTSDACRPSLEAPVQAIMNDEVYFVRPATPLASVIDSLLTCAVDRLFVLDDNDSLVGVISVTDVMRHLNAPPANPSSRRATPRRRVTPRLPSRPSPFRASPRTGSDIVMAGARGAYR